MNWYRETAQTTLEELNVNQNQGLSSNQALSRLKTYGPNILASRRKETLVGIFVRQFKSPLIYILILAAILVLSLGQKTDAIVIIAVITINAIIGTIQEGRARNSLERLKSLTKHNASVRRDGQEILIPSEEVVPGDILILHEGDRIAADARIIKSENFIVDESVLTGEAIPVNKIQEPIYKENLVLGDQKNMVFAGTSITSGYGEAVVVATGLDSELGKISKGLLETSDVPLPLERKVTRLSHQIAFVVFAIAFLVFIFGLLRQIPTKEIFGAVIGLSVSIIPEGLPIVVTIVLARGVWRMAKAHAIVRKMAAIEAMSGADVLLVDKTGTITTGKMVIKQVVCGEDQFEVNGDGYDPKGEITSAKNIKTDKLKKILSQTYLALKADVVKDENGDWRAVGDPTEAAIAVLCRKIGLSKNRLAKEYKTVSLQPFDSTKRYIEATFERGKEQWNVYIGAPDSLGRHLKIDHVLSHKYHELTNRGLRVVGIVLIGPQDELFGYSLLSMEEEVRPNVKSSISEAKKAGFKVVMMTGDFSLTAKAIAQNVGIFTEEDGILTGAEVEQIPENELAEKIEKVTVFARITPIHKLKIAKAFQAKRHVVAMTGDGVNDAPALQAANLGIAVGSGTQVAKDAADIVLVDNNFATITSAIAEGRGIYITLKKVILYLFSTSFGEALVISAAVILGLPLPLLAVQIIWLNFVTDGFLDIALAQDPSEGYLLQKRIRSENLVDSLMIQRILVMGSVMLFATLPVFYYFSTTSSLTYARSMTLLILSVIQWFNALNVRSQDQSIFKMPLTNNWFLIGAFVIVATLQIFAIQTPWGNKLLHTEPLTFGNWLTAFVVSSLIIVTEEIRKLYVRSKNNAMA